MTSDSSLRFLNAGFTLIEMMIAVAIISVLLTIGVPAYQDYIRTAAQGVLANNVSSIVVFQEQYFMRNGFYADDLADQAAIEAEIGWDPRTDDIDYSIAASADPALSYRVTATNTDGVSICIEFPANNPCS